MAAGTFDANGIWRYGEDDAASPVSSLLNLGMDSVSAVVADLNARVSALEEPAAWTSWAPALTTNTGTNPNLGTGGVRTGRAHKVGNLVVAYFNIKFGTSGTSAGSGFYRVSLPYPSRTTSQEDTIGVLWLYQSGTNESIGVLAPVSSTTAELRPHGTEAASHYTPWAWGPNHAIRGLLTYETTA